MQITKTQTDFRLRKFFGVDFCNVQFLLIYKKGIIESGDVEDVEGWLFNIYAICRSSPERSELFSFIFSTWWLTSLHFILDQKWINRIFPDWISCLSPYFVPTFHEQNQEKPRQQFSDKSRKSVFTSILGSVLLKNKEMRVFCWE